MKTTRFHSSVFFSFLIALAFLGTSVAFAADMETTECSDCAEAQQAASLKAADVSDAQNSIQTLKDQIENDLGDISTNADPIDTQFEQAITDLIAGSGCTTEEAYSDILPDVGGIKGYLYDSLFYCPDTTAFEQFVIDGFSGNMVQWSTEFDPNNTTAWEAISAQYVQLEQDLDDYFASLLEYEQLLSDALTCVETMQELQAGGECTEETIDHEETDIPEDFTDPIDCPDCAENAAALEEVNGQLTDIEDEITAKNEQIASLNDQLSTDEQFSTDLAALFVSVGCDTDQAFADIEVQSGQAAGVLYDQTYYCQNEADVEALIAALVGFWDAHTVPSGDETIVDQINTLLAEIETLQDEYNDLIANKVTLQETYQDCLDLLLTLQDGGSCLATEEEDNGNGGDEDTGGDSGTIEEPAVGETVTIPASKRRSGSGGGSKSLNFCDYAIFSDIAPVPNTMTSKLSTLSFAALGTVKLDTIQLTVAGQTLELQATKIDDGSYVINAALPTPITTDGKYRVELFGQVKTSPVCARQRLYTIEVNSKIGSVVDDPNTPEDETAGLPHEGDLFSEVEFTDIANHWAKEFILKLAQRGIIEGYGDGRFGPDNNVTRAELTKIALEAFAIGKMDVQTSPFPDVDAVQWYAPYIAQAKSLLIVSGYADGTFQPNSPVTRGEGLKILLGAAGIDTSAFATTVSNFSDVETDAFYSQFVNWAVDKGIVSGYGNGMFGPNDTLTRGQLAKITINLLEYLNR